MMGVAAYNRGSNVIARSLREDDRPVEFMLMDRLNALEKYPDAGTPPVPVQIIHSRGLVWLVPKDKPDGFGYWYKSINQLMKRWKIQITGINTLTGIWDVDIVEEEKYENQKT